MSAGRVITVTAPDGVRLSVHECGNPDGPEIVFMHGFSQSRLAWRRQMPDPTLRAEYQLDAHLPRGRVAADRMRAGGDPLPADMAATFRMVAYDLRGHGASDKPLDGKFYKDDRIWADDLQAVMDATGLKRPVLVAWSYAGRIVSDYVRVHGQGRIAGVNFVGAVTKSDKTHWGAALRLTAVMCSDDLSTNVHASRRFVHACFAGKPAGDEMELTLGYTMMVPPAVRALVLDRSRNTGDMLPQLEVPVLVTHGALDRIINLKAAHDTAADIPGARLSVYGGVGHSPFFEQPGRFNRELAAFARECAAATR